jgi:hypothetical protein
MHTKLTPAQIGDLVRLSAAVNHARSAGDKLWIGITEAALYEFITPLMRRAQFKLVAEKEMAS